MQIITGETTIEKHKYLEQEIYLKREDLNSSGSFKDRLVEYIWPTLLKLPSKKIVLSSSGNFAISLLYFYIHSGEKLDKEIVIFVSNTLPELKLTKLKRLIAQSAQTLIITKKPKSEAIKYAKQESAYLLRASSDFTNRFAYTKLGQEILVYEEKQKIQFDAVFICASSGLAAAGIMEEFLSHSRHLPVYIVQTSHINSISKFYDPGVNYEEKTLANAISDRIARNKEPIKELITKLKGSGVVVNNQEIYLSLEIFRNLDIDVSLENKLNGNIVLSLAGLFRLLKKGNNFTKPLLIISGN